MGAEEARSLDLHAQEGDIVERTRSANANVPMRKLKKTEGSVLLSLLFWVSGKEDSDEVSRVQ